MKDVRICFIGDSFVNGTGDPACLGWTGRVCAVAISQGHEVTYYNLGIRRQTSLEIARRWRSEVEARLPHGCDGRLVFSFGVNDTVLENERPRLDSQESLRHAREMLRAACELCPTLMVGPPPMPDDEQNQRIASLSEQFALLCQELAIPYLDVFTPLLQVAQWREEALANDGAHPRAAGYSALAHLVQDWPTWQSWFA
ncbi:GDSL-type esterase/lipase family protein [Dictyobacter aurantiacus]|uniref:GDSL-type esterase/lipase family protein n=1 Tax=Dictyobacter aurantiacus TaxID=1936993 RepID=UPI001C3F5FEA|nr:GDSL-type esterase/lipase family protein [Dictyobacter aurantiacus]